MIAAHLQSRFSQHTPTYSELRAGAAASCFSASVGKFKLNFLPCAAPPRSSRAASSKALAASSSVENLPFRFCFPSEKLGVPEGGGPN